MEAVFFACLNFNNPTLIRRAKKPIGVLKPSVAREFAKALKYNISIDIDANMKLANWIDDFDLCTLFGNLLDNAIEASIKEEESKRYINVRAKVIKSFLTISVENNTVEGEEIDFVSRKDDQENHGFGMKNIKNVINKYSGEMTFETNNSCISIFVMLNKV